jgi:hypothetical protein
MGHIKNAPKKYKNSPILPKFALFVFFGGIFAFFGGIFVFLGGVFNFILK